MGSHMLPPAEVVVPVQRGESDRLICDRCGCIVVRTDTHAQWHAWVDAHTHTIPGEPPRPEQ